MVRDTQTPATIRPTVEFSFVGIASPHNRLYEPSRAVSIEENKALILRIVEAINKGGTTFVAKAPEFYSDDIVLHDAHSQDIRGLHDYVERHIKHLFEVFPDASVAVEDTFAEGDKVVSRMTITGTQTGEIHHFPFDLHATNKRVRIDAIYIQRISGGKVAEEWEKQDTLGVMRQLGYELSPTASEGT